MSESITELSGPLAGVELGPAAQACNERERRFAFLVAINACENATEAAERAGYSAKSRDGLSVTAHELMHRERVLAAVKEFTRNAFAGLEPVCVAKVRKIVENEKHRDHPKVCLSLLSRFGYGEQTRAELNITGTVTLDHTGAALDDLRKLKSLGFSREQLLEIFGSFGLGRYEKMLAEKDGKTIEHQPNAGSIDPPREATE